MKIVYLVTLLASLLIFPIIIIVMLPIAFVAALTTFVAKKILNSMTNWINYLNDGLKGE